MEIVAQSWLVLQLTSSPLMLGLTGLTHAIPTIALTLVGGVIADRTDRRRIMIFTQGTTACLFLSLATLAITDTVRIWHVMLFTFLSGACEPLTGRADTPLFPRWFPPRRYQML